MTQHLRISIRTRLALELAAGLCLMAAVVIGVSSILVIERPEASLPVVVSLPGVPVGSPPGNGHRIVTTGITRAAVPGQVSRPPDLDRRLRPQAIWSLVLTWAAVAGGLVAASGVLCWLLATRMTRRLRSITGAARRLSAGGLDQRIALSGPHDELRELADTFDGVLSHLDAALSGRRQFTANAAHELRTPLAVIRAQVDVALSDPATTRAELLATVRVVGEAVDRCQHLLDGLLTLARGERGPVAAESVDLAQIAVQAMKWVAPRAEHARVTMRATCRPAPVHGERLLLERAAGNLIDNAVAYNRDGGWVDVSTERDGDRSLLRVNNSGPLVPPERVDDLFEPFVRLSPGGERSGPGAGLGLSIVRTTARAHRGTVSARALPGGGLEVTLALPGTLEAGDSADRDGVVLTAT